MLIKCKKINGVLVKTEIPYTVNEKIKIIIEKIEAGEIGKMSIYSCLRSINGTGNFFDENIAKLELKGK